MMKIAFAAAAGLAALMVLVAAIGGHGVSPVYAIPTTPNEPEVPPCLADVSGTLTATPASVHLGRSATLRWSVHVPRDCAQLRLELNGPRLGLNGQPVSRQGALRVTPIATSMFALNAKWRGRRVGAIATVTLNVILPPRVTIDANHLAPLLRQAVSTRDTRIRVLNGVELDLTPYGYENMRVARGVRLIGGHTAREPGPLLYTKIRKTLFLIQTDKDHDVRHVRISGLRIQGPDDTEIVDGGDKSIAIYLNSAVDVEIDHNELYGWKNEAIGVDDEYNDRISYKRNPWTVRIHDNYIHHNQEKDSAGYGVVVGSGAFALIERNVFDYNRHAIAGDGSDWSGYRADRNLVLQHGGRHKSWGIWRHTHQFDMHGQDSCGGISGWCGTAGYAIEIFLNSFLYDPDDFPIPDPPVIRIRGTPQHKPCGAVVSSNVFVQYYLYEAVKQNGTGVCKVNNRLGINGSARTRLCDFDGDGTNDRFMATGQTWWYASRGTGPWVYLNTSQKLLSELTFGQLDGDSRCDVAADGLISSGGTSPWRPR
jgi:Right handed beta helix region